MAVVLADTPKWLQRLYYRIKNGDAAAFRRFQNFLDLWVKWHHLLPSHRIVQPELF